MKKKNGFTLIELLAVIIILGILMIIAIPSVTKYISDSRKSAYIDTAKGIISGARNLVNTGKLRMYDTSATYYIPISCIKTENGAKTPYGEFENDGAYVGVTFDGEGYNYYWISNDTSGQGIKEITLSSELDEDDIESGINEGEVQGIIQTTGIDGRNNIKIFNSDCTVASNGGGSGSGATNPTGKICRPATVLHTKTCERASRGCGDVVGNGNTITYGTLVSGSPKAGDAFDCDVNNDGVYNSQTERFYYVKSDGNNSILIYYTNMNGQTTYEYDLSNENWHGPRTVYQYLPNTSSWSHSQLIAPGTRNIVTEDGSVSTDGGTIDSFTYTNKAARLLTVQEINSACGITIGFYTTGELNECKWLLENIGLFENNDNTGNVGYWLENPRTISLYGAWFVNGQTRASYSTYAEYGTYYGARPVITVLTSNISN